MFIPRHTFCFKLMYMVADNLNTNMQHRRKKITGLNKPANKKSCRKLSPFKVKPLPVGRYQVQDYHTRQQYFNDTGANKTYWKTIT